MLRVRMLSGWLFKGDSETRVLYSSGARMYYEEYFRRISEIDLRTCYAYCFRTHYKGSVVCKIGLTCLGRW